MTASYDLLDIAERQTMWPWSVTIPSELERISVLPGDRVKLDLLPASC